MRPAERPCGPTPSRRWIERTQRVLGRVGTLATELVGLGLDRGTPSLATVAHESRRDLNDLGLDRLVSSMDLVLEVLDPRSGRIAALSGMPTGRRRPRSLYARVVAPAPVPGASQGEVSPTKKITRPEVARALLRLMLVAAGARDYPRGPAPREILDPLMQRSRPAPSRPIVRGRVLIPLAAAGDGGWLVFDPKGAGLTRLMEVPVGCADPAFCWVAPRLALDHPDRLPRVHARTLLAGVPISRRVDRCILARSQGRLGLVLRHALERRADPFCEVDPPVLVGPVSAVLGPRGSITDRVRDGAGREAVVEGGLPTQGESGGLWTLLAHVGHRQGQLAMTPLVVWRGQAPGRGDRIATLESPVKSQALPADPLLDEVEAALIRLLNSGLTRGLSSRHDIVELAAPLASAGWPALARSMTGLALASGEAQAARLLCETLHLVDRLRDAVRTVTHDRGVAPPEEAL